MAEHRIQRRLAAILAADMVGYSRLMAADEARTLSRLKALRTDLLDPKIAEHHGRIVKEMGDGLLVEFASAVDAVECTVAIQRAMTEREAQVAEDIRIRYRAGINLGDIVIDGDDIFGDGVNVAARLEGLTEPAGISISGAVYDQVHNKLDLVYEDLGEKSVKNIMEPVRVFRVLPFGRPEVPDSSEAESIYRERLKARYAEDSAYYVPLAGKTTFPFTRRKHPARLAGADVEPSSSITNGYPSARISSRSSSIPCTKPLKGTRALFCWVSPVAARRQQSKLWPTSIRTGLTYCRCFSAWMNLPAARQWRTLSSKAGVARQRPVIGARRSWPPI
jgi:class 3 adenylate cyclase